MASSISSPADVVNLALSRIGFKGRIGNLFQGSMAAKKALDIYGQTRDAVLRQNQWGFAEKIVDAVASGSAAPQPWSVEYVYPDDCLQLRDMFNAAYLADKNNPLPILYTIGNNATPAKVIWTDAVGATLVYTARITDPTKWEPLFIELLAVELGKRLAPVISSLDTEKMELEDEKLIAPIAEGIDG